MNIKKLVKPNIRSLSAYEAKDIACAVKLDANESPYSAPAGQPARFSVQKNFQALNRYPDPEAKALRKIIAKEFSLRPENILHGNGSDELIYYLITTFGGPVLYPVPTFSMYGIISQALGEKKIEIPLDKEFDLDLEKILTAIKKYKPKLIFLTPPNNPTGNCFSSEKILKILPLFTVHCSLVVIDEAYHPFAGDKGFTPMLKDYKNLVILRTLSKIGLAGLRVGFLLADKDIVNEVNKVRLPFNLNSLSQTIASDALKDKALIKSNIRTIIKEREKLLDELSEINGITPYPSEANFILFKTENPAKIYKGLLKKGVLVRNLSGIVKECLRVTVGTPEENRIFLRALKKCLSI
ncbi:MAG: histidinol-phosphate transaminase [Nitrospirae bacterium]|nr:histidinol-phosphate transaminase [Nitrospirota bacterium]